MQEILTRCGYRCDLCLAYKPNVNKNPSNQSKLSDGWYKYYGFRLSPEKIICDSCMNKNPKLIDQSCPVRPCVIEKGWDHCSHCEQYICEKLSQRLVVYEGVKARLNAEIPDEDYRCFIQPYENKLRLEVLRSSSKARSLGE